MRLREGGRERDVYLGKVTRLDHGLRIVDWRHAPVSRIFYRYAEGDEYDEEFDEGSLKAKLWHAASGDSRRNSPADSGSSRTVPQAR